MNILIIICFILIFSLPPASGATDIVWAARASGFIKSDESLFFENYIIKATALDNEKASISVLRNNAHLETSNFRINDFKKYDEVGVTLLGIKGGYSWISISKFENKDIWQPISSVILNWGETHRIENYTIEIDSFGNDSVDLLISNKIMSEKKFFQKGDFKDYESLRLAVTDINMTGFIELLFFTDRDPPIKAEIFTDRDEYFPDEPINVTVITGDYSQHNIMGVMLDSSPRGEIVPSRFSTTGSTGTGSFYSQITRQPPNSTLTIIANIETRDYYNHPGVMSVNKSVSITPDVAIIKKVQADDENVWVQLYVHNSAAGNKSIHIRDIIPEELAARALNWSIELPPGKSTTLQYNITPDKPGTYLLPAASAQWEGQSAASGGARFTIHMPHVSLAKSAVFNKGFTQVKLIISNTGDRPAQVKVSDRVPEGKRATGNTAWSGKLDGGENATISYSLQGEIADLPEASATYRDLHGVTRSAQSNVNNMAAGSETQNMHRGKPLNVLPNEMLLFMVSSFFGIAGIMIFMAMVAYAATRFGGK